MIAHAKQVRGLPDPSFALSIALPESKCQPHLDYGTLAEWLQVASNNCVAKYQLFAQIKKGEK